MKNVLFIHQSTELYGSNKTLLLLVTGFKEKGINPLVVLPHKGPLSVILEEKGITVIIAPVFKISRTMFGIRNLFSLMSTVRNSMHIIDQATRDLKIDLVYSNTLAVLMGVLYAKKKRLKHVWHVHEIVAKPFFVKYIFQKFLGLRANHVIIYNSQTTRDFWENRANKPKNKVVLNGISRENHLISDEHIQIIKSELFDLKPGEITIALVGRINRWKGHVFLLNSFRELLQKHPHIKLIFVGSPPINQEKYIHHLEREIARHRLQEQVRLIPFQDNIWNIWEAIDIAVVPSTEPEPFGLVTVEAMLCRKPVIASNHGGTTEIVLHDETGLLFEPNNSAMLVSCLEEVLTNKARREQMGEKGYERAMKFFTRERYVTEIESVCLDLHLTHFKL